MKIVAISDTHSRHNKIEAFKEVDKAGNYKEALGGDVIIHSGDATGRGDLWEVENFLEWYGKLDFVHKIFVPGNHDWACERQPALIKEIAEKNGVILLNDSGIEIDGVKFWGSPVQPWFYSWAFNRRRTLEEATRYNDAWIKNHWDLIPLDTNVLITHGPPYKILDQLMYASGDWKQEWVGCEELMHAVSRIKPKIHIFGHIHCSYGYKEFNGTHFYNASICGESYYVDNEPHIIDYEK